MPILFLNIVSLISLHIYHIYIPQHSSWNYYNVTINIITQLQGDKNALTCENGDACFVLYRGVLQKDIKMQNIASVCAAVVKNSKIWEEPVINL